VIEGEDILEPLQLETAIKRAAELWNIQWSGN
jgi:hypothetical protein